MFNDKLPALRHNDFSMWLQKHAGSKPNGCVGKANSCSYSIITMFIREKFQLSYPKTIGRFYYRMGLRRKLPTWAYSFLKFIDINYPNNYDLIAKEALILWQGFVYEQTH